MKSVDPSSSSPKALPVGSLAVLKQVNTITRSVMLIHEVVPSKPTSDARMCLLESRCPVWYPWCEDHSDRRSMRDVSIYVNPSNSVTSYVGPPNAKAFILKALPLEVWSRSVQENGNRMTWSLCDCRQVNTRHLFWKRRFHWKRGRIPLTLVSASSYTEIRSCERHALLACAWSIETTLNQNFTGPMAKAEPRHVIE